MRRTEIENETVRIEEKKKQRMENRKMEILMKEVQKKKIE